MTKFSIGLKKKQTQQHTILEGKISTAFSITDNYECISDPEIFHDLLKVLMVFAHRLISDITLRDKKNKTELAYDLAMESITRYLEAPEKFNPSRNPDLVLFLKFNILKRLISNHHELKSQQNEYLYERDDSIGISVSERFINTFEIHSTLDLKDVVSNIQDEIQNEKQLSRLFHLRYIEDYKRAEIIKEMGLSEGDYNNLIRRLDSVRNRVINGEHKQLKYD